MKMGRFFVESSKNIGIVDVCEMENEIYLSVTLKSLFLFSANLLQTII